MAKAGVRDLSLFDGDEGSGVLWSATFGCVKWHVMTDRNEVIVTGELSRRPTRAPDYEAENRALLALARATADAPETVLQRLVETAKELCDADTAGVSLLEEQEGGLVSRWHAVAGVYARHLTGVSPDDFGPGGRAGDPAAPELLLHPGRRFASLDAAEPRIAENLLVPFGINGRPVGTIWLLAREDGRRFDAEDVRVMSDLAEFCAAALQTARPAAPGRAGGSTPTPSSRSSPPHAGRRRSTTAGWGRRPSGRGGRASSGSTCWCRTSPTTRS